MTGRTFTVIQMNKFDVSYAFNNTRPFFTLGFNCSVHDDFCRTDHFPIIVEGNDPLKTYCTENWKLNKAEWTLFESLCLKTISSRELESQSDPIKKFTESALLINAYLNPRRVSKKNLKTRVYR